MNTLPYTLEEQWKERDKMDTLSRFTWWVKGVKEGLIACGCDSCNALLEAVVKQEKALRARLKPTEKQYKVTRTYFVTCNPDEDIEEHWRNLNNEFEYQEDEKVELVAEV